MIQLNSSQTADGSVSAALVSAAQLTDAGFFNTSLAKRLRTDPLGLVDIGARWGVSDIFHAVAPLVDAVAFEPDRDEAVRIEETERRDRAWNSLEIWPEALGSGRGTTTLHLLKRPNNSSVFPVNGHYAARYDLMGFELDRIVQVPITDLDSLACGGRLRAARAGEVIKMDTQGAEFDIVLGAARVLTERTVCVVTEAAFFSPYEGAKLFSEVEQALRGHGLQFYGFLDFKHRSTRRIDKRQTLGRERMMQADAVFFRDPCETPAAMNMANERAITVVWVMALLLGYFDFCLELIELLGRKSPDTDADEQTRLRNVVEQVSRADQEAAQMSARQLVSQIAGDPSNATVELGRFVDLRRDYQSYHEIK